MTTAADDGARGFGAGMRGTVVGAPTETHGTLARKAILDRAVRCNGTMDVRSHGVVVGTKVCNKLLVEYAARPWRVTCPRCHQVNESPPEASAAGSTSMPLTA